MKNLQREIGSTNTHLKSSPRHFGDIQRQSEIKANSKQTHEAMSHIFKLIADKDTSQEGIVKLYEFKVDMQSNANQQIIHFLVVLLDAVPRS